MFDLSFRSHKTESKLINTNKKKASLLSQQKPLKIGWHHTESWIKNRKMWMLTWTSSAWCSRGFSATFFWCGVGSHLFTSRHCRWAWRIWGLGLHDRGLGAQFFSTLNRSHWKGYGRKVMDIAYLDEIERSWRGTGKRHFLGA